jgi:hypothetical protein
MIMRTKTLLLGATGLFMAGSLLAHVTTQSHQPHKDIEFTAVTATYQFQDGTKAEWAANRDGSYTVTITQDPAQNRNDNDQGATSLLTLGIQGIDDHTRMTLVTGTGVKVFDATKPNPSWKDITPNQAVPMAKTGTKLLSGRPVVDEDKVSFIRFTGTTCKLTVASDRSRKGHTKWHGMGGLTNHDNTPPGVPPGSEN